MRTQLYATLFGLLTFASAGARAESDWFASLYTGEGIELRADERVFTLYALLNAMGYDRAPVVREHPLPKYQYHPVRKSLRERLAQLDPEVRKQADAFFDAHPAPLSRYLAYAVNSAPPPFSTGAKAKELSDLKGLEALLAKAYSAWRLDQLLASVQAEYRKALRGYLTALDTPMAKAQRLLKQKSDGGQPLLVMNLLEAPGEVSGTLGDAHPVLVVGPSDTPNVEGVLREYARLYLEPQVAKRAQGGWAGGAGLLREAQLLGARELTVGEYATALFSRALALKALDASDAAYDEAARRGYFGLKDIARGFDDPRPVEAWALEALARAETRRPAPKK